MPDKISWIELIPKWIISAAFLLFVLLLTVLYFTGKKFNYKDGFSFSDPTVQKVNPLTHIAASSSSTSNDGIFQDTIIIEKPGILFLQAQGTGGWNGALTNAGVRVNAFVNGELCASNTNFEGETANVNFTASVSCIKHLEVGTCLLYTSDAADE